MVDLADYNRTKRIQSFTVGICALAYFTVVMFSDTFRLAGRLLSFNMGKLMTRSRDDDIGDYVLTLLIREQQVTACTLIVIPYTGFCA